MIGARLLCIAFACHLSGVVLTDGGKLAMKKLDEKINSFIEKNRYPGVVVGVKIGNKLSFLRSYGNNSDGRPLLSKDLLPVSSLSKTLTAVAIMKLVEQKKLNMTSQVFGHGGVLWMIKPMKKAKVDHRLEMITIEHLLRHTAGWKQNKGPLYDPILNRFYILRGYHVPNLAREMNVKGNLLPHHMIRYVMSQTLECTPGTEYHYYNLGYSILGRVIEEVTGMGYEEYVKQTILIPAGMWQTRIGPQKARDFNHKTPDQYSIEDIVHPEVLDSTLGWHSTVADMMRLMSCLDGTGTVQLLQPESVLLMLAMPPLPHAQHVEKWVAAGFIAKNDGSFWQIADEHFNDMVFYNGATNRPVSNRVEKEFARGPRDLSFAFVFTSNRYKPLKHVVKRIIKEVTTWPLSDNHFTDDLADTTSTVKGIQTVSHFRLPEPHLSAYSNALMNQGYVPKWISAFQFEKKTFFSTIFTKGLGEKHVEKQKMNFAKEAPHEFMVHHGLTNRKLRKLLHRRYDYHLSFVQSYVSSSHDQTLCNVAILTKGKKRVKQGLTRKMNLYKELTKRLYKKKYMPVVQSIETRGEKPVVTYILQKVKQAKYKAMTDLSLEELEQNIKINGVNNRNLIYLDTYVVHGKTKFSAIFSHEKTNGWLLENRVTQEEIQSKTAKMETRGYTPQLSVGYEIDGQLLYSFAWKRY